MTAPLDTFLEALTCGQVVWNWTFGPDGALLSTNCPEPVFARIFGYTGCKDYMLQNAGPTPLILSSAPGLVWCAVYGPDRILVIGPVYNSALPKRELEAQLRVPELSVSAHTSLSELLNALPVVSGTVFFRYAVMLQYFVTGDKLRHSDIRFQQGTEGPAGEAAGSAGSSGLKAYQAGEAVLRMVTEGNLDYALALDRASTVSSGVGGDTEGDPLLRTLITACTFVSLCARAAIEGGLSPELAFSLNDSYVQSLTVCQTVTEIAALTHGMYEDFIRRVHDLKAGPPCSRPVQLALDYIGLHTEEDLTLKTVADALGYSESYLSRKFRAETGRNLSETVRDAKLRRAKLLLDSTDLSIQEIAEKLHFCSAGYFSSFFRKYAGLLPQAYRENTKHEA